MRNTESMLKVLWQELQQSNDDLDHIYITILTIFLELLSWSVQSKSNYKSQNLHVLCFLSTFHQSWSRDISVLKPDYQSSLAAAVSASLQYVAINSRPCYHYHRWSRSCCIIILWSSYCYVLWIVKWYTMCNTMDPRCAVPPSSISFSESCPSTCLHILRLHGASWAY